MLALRDGDVPQTISTSYSDSEQTGKNSHPIPSHPIPSHRPSMLRCAPGFQGLSFVRRYLELISASFLVPKDYAIRVCKEFALLGESYFI
jgi:hypothetical protein